MTKDGDERRLSSIALTDYSVGGRFVLHVRSFRNFTCGEFSALDDHALSAVHANALGRHWIIGDQVVESCEHHLGFGAVLCNDGDEAFQRQ